MKINKTLSETFQIRLDSIEPIDKYSICSTYIKANIVVKLKHEKCGTIFDIRPEKFTGKRQQRCPECSKNKKKEEFFNNFKILFEEQSNGEYKLINESDYETNESKIRILHLICGNEFAMKANNFTSNRQKCPKCAEKTRTQMIVEVGKRNKLTKEIVNTRLKDRGYELISEYTNDIDKLTFKHNKCAREFKASSKDLLYGTSCPLCDRAKKRLTNDEYFDRIRKKDNNEYEPLEKYKGSNKLKHLVLHKTCNTKFESTPNHMLNSANTGCPTCNNSQGEKEITRVLSENGIQFESQFVDPRCKNKKVLPFDFKIDLKNGKKLLIEYDGIQHFEPTFGSDDAEKLKNFSIQRFRDGIKDSFCKAFSTEYDLVRISYKQKNSINDLLNGIMQKHGLKN